ncbi:MAG TPA: hypothetical protein VMH39_14470 [Gemmatimonadaceae bacterium]|nr:hypothetical protein [Gemmatimonadaceae bacterium]
MTNLTVLLIGPAAVQSEPTQLAAYQIVELVQGGLFAMVLMALGIPLVRAISRRFVDRQRSGVSSADAARLERIEQAVDAIAVEVERIAEAQRFSAKLAADQLSDGRDGAQLSPGAAAGRPGRPNTMAPRANPER